MKVYYFGYDLENIENVMVYVKEKYISDIDYEMSIGMGDDVMNCLEVFNEELIKDKEFVRLVELCEKDIIYEFDDE